MAGKAMLTMNRSRLDRNAAAEVTRRTILGEAVPARLRRRFVVSPLTTGVGSAGSVMIVLRGQVSS
jgi:hypothetical protein